VSKLQKYPDTDVNSKISCLLDGIALCFYFELCLLLEIAEGVKCGPFAHLCQPRAHHIVEKKEEAQMFMF
jgi:hypothetical protein